MSSGLALGVCALPERGLNLSRSVQYPQYIFEILEHAGLFHERLAFDRLEHELDGIRILVTVGETGLSEALKSKLADWIAKGGAWISVGGACGMEDALGASLSEPAMWSWAGGMRSLGEGYLVALDKNHPVLTPVTRPVHLFGGATIVPRGARVLARVDDMHGRPTARPALLENRSGQGRTLLIAPDVTGTIVRIQQGVGVTRDGVPAPDGSAPMNDLILKADDGAVLDWELDRDPVPGVRNYRAFLEPAADVWREILLRSIFYVAREHGVALPLLWLYPRRLAALAHMSLDSDGNEPEKAERLLELLAQADAEASWCIILPGYDAAITAKIRNAGHELATHYDAISEGRKWSQAQWREQFLKLQAMFGETPVTNKNHMARWEGDCEFFEWCVEAGIQIDQSKAVSKTGEAGFNFGTCHLYFPMTFAGKMIDCLEMCTLVWDLHTFAPVQIFAALLESVKRHHGVLHQLFHPYHVTNPDVAKSLVDCVREAREAGLEWWTARRINQWERARRSVKLQRFNYEAGTSSITLRAESELRDATVLCLNPDHAETGEPFSAWGFNFAAAVETIPAGQPVTIKLK